MLPIRGAANMDFFIAYHAADYSWADWMAARLTAAGYAVELQSWDYWANSNLLLEMFAVSALADATIALLSPDFLAENLERPEWAAAYAQDPTAAAGILIPVKVRECDTAGLLPAAAIIDLAGLAADAAADLLLAAIGARKG